MSSKLDQSLEEIAGTRRGGGARRGGRRGGKPAAPVAGGVTKRTVTRAPKPATQTVTPALPSRGESKIIVSNLPEDVNEQQIKDYFSTTVGTVKKVLLNYNKSGRSVGVATIIFSQATSAAEAAKAYDGVKVDGRPMRIEVILGAKFAPAPPPVKTLSDRISGAKNTPKNAGGKPKNAAAAPKPAAAAAGNGAARGGAGRGRGRGRGGRGGGARPKKTAQELDAEMQDYFEPANGAAAAPATNGAAPAAATNGGEATMVDEVN